MPRIVFALSLFATVFAFAAPVQAATIVVGGGLAEDCYKASDDLRRDAVQICTLALEANAPMSRRDRAATYINRGYALLYAGKYQDAMRDCETSMRLAPELGEAYLNRGVALLALKRAEEALGPINQSIEIGFDKLYLAYFNRAMAKEDLGDIKGAYEDYRKALELEPNFVLAANELKRFRVTDH